VSDCVYMETPALRRHTRTKNSAADTEEERPQGRAALHLGLRLLGLVACRPGAAEDKQLRRAAVLGLEAPHAQPLVQVQHLERALHLPPAGLQADLPPAARRAPPSGERTSSRGPGAPVRRARQQQPSPTSCEHGGPGDGPPGWPLGVKTLHTYGSRARAW